MIVNYFKIAIRNLRRHKGFSLASICGLSLGFSCCIAIFLFVEDELSYDRYHVKSDRIYRLATNVDGASFQGIAKVNGPWGTTAINTLPEIERMTRFVFAGEPLVEKNEKRFYEPDGFYADSVVFDVFDFEIIEGENFPLHRPDGIVITQSLEKKYFGDQHAVGQTLSLNSKEHVVTAVIRDVPLNSHFRFSFLLPMASYHHPDMENWTRWNQFYTYLLLRPGVSSESVAKKFEALLPRYIDPTVAVTYHPFLQPLTSIHLHSHLFREISANSDVMYVYIFSSIGILILIISAINFVNLSTARAMLRAKEVGIRKASGALRTQLMTQYLTESVILCLAALTFAFIIIVFALPLFNSIMDKQLTLNFFRNPVFMASSGGITILVGLVAGSYAALFLASLKPADVLKGTFRISGKNRMRESLVVAQFAISAFLIIASTLIVRQLEFIQDKSLGFEPSALVTVPLLDNALKEKTETLKNELLTDPSILSVSFSGNQPGGSDWGIPCVPEGIAAEQIPPIRVLAVDPDFVKTYQMEIVSGRDFSRNNISDSAAYLINEEAARQLGWGDPVGKMISMPAVGRLNGPVVGVVKDFHFRSLKEKIGPVLLFIPPPSWMTVGTIRLSTSSMEDGLQSLEKKWLAFDPSYPFTFSFFDQTFGRLYTAEKRLGEMVGFFTFIGIFIACLGLLSLTAFVTGQRTKEIGIRKVLGASLPAITFLLSRDLVKLVLFGFLIAIPAGYYSMQQWLGNFAYRITISPGSFILAGTLTIFLAWITISAKILNAALANPTDSLRSE